MHMVTMTQHFMMPMTLKIAMATMVQSSHSVIFLRTLMFTTTFLMIIMATTHLTIMVTTPLIIMEATILQITMITIMTLITNLIMSATNMNQSPYTINHHHTMTPIMIVSTMKHLFYSILNSLKRK